jgi:hypothetical protein
MAQLTPEQLSRVLAFLDQISPVQKRQLTVLESGRGGPGINIPLAWDTNPANFPRYEFRDYPKMLVRRATAADIADWKQRKAVDQSQVLGAPPCIEKGKESWLPMLATNEHVQNGFASSVGEPLIMQSKEQEEEFFGQHPEAKTVDIPLSAGVGDLVNTAGVASGKKPGEETELDRINRENAELEALAAARKRNAELRAQLGDAEGEKPKRQYTRRPKTPGETVPPAGSTTPTGDLPTNEPAPAESQSQFEMPQNLG